MKWLKVLKLCGLALVATGFGLFLGGELTALETAAPTSAYQSSANSPITTGQPVRVRMRDGAELSGDLYLPAGEGPFPTLVRKSPYERDRRANDERIGTAHYFVANGYAVLIVSQRGRFGSDGIFHQARNEGWLEHKDGYDTIEWAAAQPWSNGKIGTYGISADGQWQLATGPTRPPHLVAMFAAYSAHHRIGGRVERGAYTSMGTTWHHNNNAFPRPLRTREDYVSWLADWKRTQLPLLASFIHPELVEQFLHPAYDEYWRQLDPGTRYQDFDVPIYHESGWYDRYVRPTVQNFKGIRKQGRSNKTRQSQKLILGPWLHGGRVAPETETFKFGPDAQIDHAALVLRWHDYWLKGIDTGIMKEPAVRVYLIGAERWLEADSWPYPGTQYLQYYLRAGQGQPTGSLNDGRLLVEAPASESPNEYMHDPYDPIPTIGGHGGFGGIWESGSLDQRPSESRSLTFTTDVLEADLEVVGEVRARFFASSSAFDTDFVLTLNDVYPNGYSALLRQNIVRGRFRVNEETEALLTPNQIYEFTLTMDGIANLFKAGHRVRLTIASSSFPAYLPNPGTAQPMHLETQGVTAQNVIYHDSRHPSSLELPVRGQ